MTSQYCVNLTVGVKFRSITEQIAIRLEDNNEEKGTTVYASVFHDGKMYELYKKPKHTPNLLKRNEFHTIEVKVIDEKLFVNFIQNSLKDRIKTTLLN